jgi:hypothetical protein
MNKKNIRVRKGQGGRGVNGHFKRSTTGVGDQRGTIVPSTRAAEP